MKNQLRTLIALCSLILMLPCLAQNTVINIIHSNDTHSQIDPRVSKGKATGGVVERAAILEAFRKQDPSMLYLDAGDMVQGSPYFNIYNGEVEMKAMNLQGLLCSTLGNHEFDNGLEGLKKMLEIANFPLVSCNYDCTGTPIEPYIKRSIIVKRNGVKIGITGVTVNPNNLVFNKNWDGIKYSDPTESANKEAEALRKKGCDLVILLSHVGYFADGKDGDLYIAKNSRNIDIIIGGHTHTNLNGLQVKNADNQPIWVTQTGGKGYDMGHIQVKLTKKHQQGHKYAIEEVAIKKIGTNELDINGYGKDMEAFLQPYKDKLEAKMSAVIGTSSETMGRRRPQSQLGNLTADALRVMGEKKTGQKIDVAIMNSGGIRSDLDKGDITIGTMFRLYPFENTLTILEIKGKHLKAAIEGVAGKGLEPISGMQVVLDKEGDRVFAAEVKVNGETIDPERIYIVATIDYLAEGNDGFTSLAYYEKSINTGLLLRDVMIEYVKELTAANKIIESKIDNRVTNK